VIGSLGSASASTVLYTFTGTVTSGSDNLGLLGTAGANYINDQFTAVFTYDTSQGTIYSNPGSVVQVAGGTGDDASVGTPAVTATIEIGGVTLGSIFTSFPTTAGDIGIETSLPDVFADVGTDYVIPGCTNNCGYGGFDMTMANNSSVPIPLSLTMPGTYALSGYADDFLQEYNYDCSPGPSCVPTTSEELTFNATSLVISVAAVPEPATWAMMLLGFGGIGGMLRGARRKQAATTA
jgi:hypothetical protein